MSVNDTKDVVMIDDEYQGWLNIIKNYKVFFLNFSIFHLYILLDSTYCI